MKQEFRRGDVLIEIGNRAKYLIYDVGVGFYLCKIEDDATFSKYANIRLEDAHQNYVKVDEWKGRLP